MKKITFLIVAVLALLSFSCEEDNMNISSLKGNWIEASSQTDTLVFNDNKSEGMFFLNRGRELRGGHMLPKINSGPYDYEIVNDSIVLRWGLSSCMCTESYEFIVLPDEDKLNVGNFYKEDIPLGTILIFEKL